MATCVEKDDTQVMRALSPLISRSPGGFGGAKPGVKAASLFARATLSGSSSTYSRLWILLTSLLGIGTMHGVVFAFTSDVPLWPPAMMGAAEIIGADETVAVEDQKVPPATAIVAGMSGSDGWERGRGAVAAGAASTYGPGLSKQQGSKIGRTYKR